MIEMVDGVLAKESSRYKDKSYLYWWDIDPQFLERLRYASFLGLLRKDSGHKCLIDTKILIPLLTPERQSTRKHKSWGLRVLVGRESEVMIDSPKESPPPFIKVTWIL